MAEQYARSAGIDLKRQSEFVEIDESRARRLADAYAAMPHAPNDPKVKEAYDDLIRQTTDQYRALEGAGYKFWFIDPAVNGEYASSPWNAMRDIRANQQMGVFPTNEGFGSSDLDVGDNPLLADTGIQWPVGGPDGKLAPVLANDLFRAVHDAFGHGLEGAGFRARGEENAWQAHARLFTGPALAALTSETRGQNSWLNFGPHGEANQAAKVEDTVFADQKTGLMPEWTWTEGRAGDAPRYSRRITPEQRTASLAAFRDGATYVAWGDADTHEFKSGEPMMVDAFHGTARPDRVGTVFRRKRATSGPMAYFTSSPELASNYAQGKQDTSLAGEDLSYANWFKVKVPGFRSPVSIDRAGTRWMPTKARHDDQPFLTNASDKDGGPPPVNRWLREGKAWYIDQKAFPDVMRRGGVQSPATAHNKPGMHRILGKPAQMSIANKRCHG